MEQKQEKKIKYKKKNKHWLFMPKTKFLGVSIIIASIILGAALIYASRTLSKSNIAIKDSASDVEKKDSKPAAIHKANLEVTKDDHVRGKYGAPVTIVEFSDFQCPFCKRFYPTISRILGNYPNSVRWVHKHFPLDALHAQARSAAEASECAAEQGKFWEFSGALYKSQSDLGVDYYTKLASDLKLDIEKFTKCVSNRKYKDKVEKDYQLGISLGVRGTPASFINGELLVGAVTYDSLRRAIQKVLPKTK